TGLPRIRAGRAALAGDTVAGIARCNPDADPERAAGSVAISLADSAVGTTEAGDGVVRIGVAGDDVGGRAAAEDVLVPVADGDRDALFECRLEEGARRRVDEGLGRRDDDLRFRIGVVREREESRRRRRGQDLEGLLHHARQTRALDAGLELRVVEPDAHARELLRLAVLLRDVEAELDDAVARDGAAGERAGPAGLGQALALRAARIARLPVVRTVVALLGAVHDAVATGHRGGLLVDRLRDPLRRGHGRAGHAVRQRIAASDVGAREAAAARRNLDGRLGDR